MVLFIFLKEWQHERTTQTIVKGKSQ